MGKLFKDSGDRRDFGTGAVRDMASGKGRFDLVPGISHYLVACIFEDGCKKYGNRNWEKGIPIGTFVDSAMRHLEKYKMGMRDEPHLSMAGWNIFCAIWTAAMIVLGLRPDTLFDLPNNATKQEVGPLSIYEVEHLKRFGLEI